MNTTDVMFATMFAVATATVGTLKETAPATPACEAPTKQIAPASVDMPLCSPDEAVVHSSWNAFGE
jgi:hypothetical protein